MRKLPGPAQRRLVHTALSAAPPSGPLDWLNFHRRKAAWAVLLLVVPFVIWLLVHRWPLWP